MTDLAGQVRPSESHHIACKDLRELCREAERQGFVFRRASHGMKVFDPTGNLIPVGVATTPRSAKNRTVQNVRAGLMRHGFDPFYVPGKKPQTSVEPVEDFIRPALPERQPEPEAAAEPEPPPPWLFGRPGTRVLNLLRARSTLAFDRKTIAERCEISVSQATSAVQYLEKKGDIERVARGRFRAKPSTVVSALRALEARARVEGRAQVPEHLTRVRVDDQGRLVMKDTHGDLWLAEPYEED